MKRHSIHFNEERISVLDLRTANAEPVHIGWAAIERLTVFKRDLFAVDLICLQVELSEGNGIELDEDMDGWNLFIDALPAHLIGCKKLSEWFSEVAFPAFAANPREIFLRGAVATQSA